MKAQTIIKTATGLSLATELWTIFMQLGRQEVLQEMLTIKWILNFKEQIAVLNKQLLINNKMGSNKI